MHEARTPLSRYVQLLRDGREREVVIAVAGKPCARLVPYESDKRHRGLDHGLESVRPEFAADAEITKLFGARGADRS